MFLKRRARTKPKKNTRKVKMEVPSEAVLPKKDKRARLIIGLLIVFVALVGFVVWRAVLASQVYLASISALIGGEEFEKLTQERVKSDEKTVVLAFTIDRSFGLPEIASISVISLGEWRLDLPTNTAVELDSGTIVEVSKLYYAGERLSNQTTGLGFLADVVEETAAVTLDGYVMLDVTRCNRTDQLCSLPALSAGLSVLNVWTSPEKASEAISRVSANVDAKSLPELLDRSYSDSIRTHEIPLDLLEHASLQGQEIVFLRPAVISEAIQRFPVRSSIMVEQARVEVYNGTDIAGLAGETGRKFKNSGINVTRTEDAPLTLETTTLFVKEYDEFASTVELLQHDLSGKAEVKAESPPFLSAGDIVVVMGYNSVEE